VCLTIYEFEKFEFLLGMNIWYDVLFTVNFLLVRLYCQNMNREISSSILVYTYRTWLYFSFLVLCRKVIQ
jgi:hypothetical protein